MNDSTKKQDGLLKDSAVLFTANAAGSVIGFSFHLAVARVGGPKIYADLGALLSLNILLSVAAFSIQTYVAAAVAKRVAAGQQVRSYLGRSIRKALLFGIFAGLLLALSMPFTARFLNLVTGYGVIVVGLGVVPLFLSSVLRGGFQGRQMFVALSSLRVLEPSVQIVLGVFLVVMGFGATGAITGTIFGIVGSAIVGFVLLRPSFEKTAVPPREPLDGGGAKYMALVVPFVASVNCFINFDVFLVKHYFAHTQAAQYVAASFMSRILFLSALSIGFALFPKTATDEIANRRGLLIRSLGYFLVFAIPFVSIISIFPDRVVSVFYGEAYSQTAGILPKMLLVYSAVGLSYLIGIYRLSRARKGVWLSFTLATIAQVILIGVLPKVSAVSFEIGDIANIMIGCSVFLLGVTLAPDIGRRLLGPKA
jgi:O-antigen/teichoic acid export membrane protein